MNTKPYAILGIAIVLLFSALCFQEGRAEDDNTDKVKLLKRVEGTWKISFRDSKWRTSAGHRKINFRLEESALRVTDYWKRKAASEKIPLAEILSNDKELYFSYRLQGHIKPVNFCLTRDGELRGSKGTVFDGIWIEVFFTR